VDVFSRSLNDIYDILAFGKNLHNGLSLKHQCFDDLCEVASALFAEGVLIKTFYPCDLSTNTIQTFGKNLHSGLSLKYQCFDDLGEVASALFGEGVLKNTFYPRDLSTNTIQTFGKNMLFLAFHSSISALTIWAKWQVLFLPKAY
jgi:hypothetical protein